MIEDGDEADGKESVERDGHEHEGGDEEGERKMSPSKALNTYAINLAKRAAEGKIDPLVGRKKELERAIHVLLRRRKNNPVFVGEAGVGKTALAEGLALAIHNERRARRAQGRRDLCARHGRAARGHAFSRRLRAAPQGGHQGRRSATRSEYCFIDEIHTIVGAGAASGGDDGCVATCSSRRSRRAICDVSDRRPTRNTSARSTRTRRWRGASSESTSSSRRRTRRCRFSTASSRTTRSITTSATRAASIKSAVELSARYVNDRFLPDKAIDVMDEAGVAGHLRGTGSDGAGHRRHARRRAHGRADGEDSGTHGFRDRSRTAADARRGHEAGRVRPGRGDRFGRARDQARAFGAEPSRQTGWRVSVRGTDGRRQDRSRAPAGKGDGRRVSPLRHVANTWSATPCRG